MGSLESTSQQTPQHLSLPQSLSPEAQAERKAALSKLLVHYQFADDPGVPPHPRLDMLHLPYDPDPKERTAAFLALKMSTFGKIILTNVIEQGSVISKELLAETAKVRHHIQALLERLAHIPSTQHDHGEQTERDLLYRTYSILFKREFLESGLPFGGSTLTDAVFGVRVKTASAPYQITRVDDIPPHVKITEADVVGVLPSGDTLRSLMAQKRLYALDFGRIRATAIWTRDEFKSVGWVVLPTCFLYLTEDREQLLPCAIQLFPSPHDDGPNPVFTPKDPPNVWLAAKMFVCNASNNMHLCQTHFMSGLTWVGLVMSLRRCLAAEHPISAFLQPFTYGYLAMWAGNTPLPTDFKTVVIKELWKQWNFQDIVTPKQFANQGIDDRATLPHFYYRDDVQDLWAVFHCLVTDIVNLTYPAESDIAQDYEIQRFAQELVDPHLNGYKGFEFDGTASNPITRLQLIELLTQCIIQWTARYQYDTLAWPWYVWIPYTPLSFKLKVPTSNDEDISIEDIKAGLIGPLSLDANLQRTAIEVVSKSQVSFLWNGDAAHPHQKPEFVGYMHGLTGAPEAIRRYFAALAQLEQSMHARDAIVKAQPLNNIVFPILPSVIQGSQAVI